MVDKAIKYIIDLLEYVDNETRSHVIEELCAFDWSQHFHDQDEMKRKEREDWECRIIECEECGRVFKWRDGIENNHRWGGHKRACCIECSMKILERFVKVCTFCGNEFRRINPGVGTLCQTCRKTDVKRELLIVQNNNRRARLAGTDHNLTHDEWFAILKLFDWKCAYCGGEYESLDHVVAISNGGGTTAENCVPCCKKCNSKKGANNHFFQISNPVYRNTILT